MSRGTPEQRDLNGLVAGLQYRGLHDAGPQVFAGCDDWLFLKEELVAIPDAQSNLAARRELFARVTTRLNDHNLHLVILPVPEKADLARTFLCGIDPSWSRRRAEAWSVVPTPPRALMVDLRPNWPQPGYWKTDSHWNTDGAEFAATRVAEAIDERISRATASIAIIQEAAHARAADLVRLAGLNDAPEWLAPAKEYEDRISVSVPSSGGLLDDTDQSVIVLAGSSYSLNSGFKERLESKLGRDVVQRSLAGGGFAGAVLGLLSSPDRLADVSVLIWEWPMRSLTQPLSEEERQFLATSEPAHP